MNLEDLRAAQVDERGTDSLQPLPGSFYEQAAEYLATLRARRDQQADQAGDPFGSEAVRQLADEVETAEEVVEALYERRVGKLIKRASLAAAGMPVDDEGLTDEERALFADLVERIQANREVVLSVLDDETGTAANLHPSPDNRRERSGPEPTDPGAESPVATEQLNATDPGLPRDPREGTEAEPPTISEGPADDPDRLTVRMTTDVGEIYGVDDRVYTLGSEDVVTLPAANAKPLLDRGAAKRVD